ncbi:hypothetical protein GH714_019356 [Hevea brasiliensis]|uniref:DUF7356 domain-containing protein n=1 Tax=Hevea brasiliensis TaxID=3981 RepID=A0A6A6M210_HEVBR|nr:hypothetical protein GH714_019356 [Hevea brasiliensis]
MDRNGIIVAVLLLILIVADVSNASLLSTFRRFVAVTGINQISPSPSPDPLLVVTNGTSNGTISKDRKVPDDSNKVDSGSKGSMAGPPPQNKREDEKSHGTTNRNDNKTDSQSEVGQNCTGMTRRCKDQDKLVACILSSQTGHKKFVVLVQNDGESDLKVTLSAPNPIDNTLLEIPKHRTRKCGTVVKYMIVWHEVWKSVDSGIKENRRKGNSLHLYYVNSMFQKKRKQHDGIPYQELEMGLPESSSANNVETAEGWDEGWDDDWDEENAVKSPAARHLGSISANGLISRSPKKDEWGNDWDD